MVIYSGADCDVFVGVFFSLSTHGNSVSAALKAMKFFRNTYLDNRTNPVDFRDHTSKVKVTGPDFRIFHHCEIRQKVCGRDNSRTAALSLMKFCMNMYVDNL